MRTLLVTLIGPERTADLVVDADTPAAELPPSLLAAGGVAEDPSAPAQWGVALTGKQPIPLAQTLDDAGVLDGSVLVVRREAPEGGAGVSAPRAGSGPAGSPMQRTRELLASREAEPGRRGRLLPALPEPTALEPPELPPAAAPGAAVRGQDDGSEHGDGAFLAPRREREPGAA